MLSSKALKIGFTNKKGTLVLVDQLDLEVPDGNLTAIIGRNGTGKTTLLRTLAGIHPPLDGTVFLDGKPLDAYSSQARARQMALVHTARFSLGYFMVEDLVALGRHPYTGFLGYLNEEDQSLVSAACEAAGVADIRQKIISELSDGEHQKVMIARALAQATPLILLDEPTAHLDLINRIEIFQLLKRLCKEKGSTIVLCTHELEAALNIADQVVMLDGKGKTITDTPQHLIQSGKLEAVFSHEAITFDKTSGRFIY